MDAKIPDNCPILTGKLEALAGHNRETLERLAKVETYINLKFSEQDKALELARQTSEDQRKEAKDANDLRLEHMNQFQRRMDKLEGTFATKDQVAALSRIVYIGLGIILTLQFLFKMVIK